MTDVEDMKQAPDAKEVKQQGKPLQKRKKYRFKPGTVALREIKCCQKSTKLLVSQPAFQRLVKEIASDYNPDIGFQPHAIQTLQEAAENYLVDLFAASNLCALSSKKQTIAPKHLCLARKIRGENVVVPL